jgi:glycolate oxidase
MAASLLELIDNATINAVEDDRHMDLDRLAAGLLVGPADGPGAGAEIGLMLASCHEAGADPAVRAMTVSESDMLLGARRLAGTAVMARGPTVVEDVGVLPVSWRGCSQPR